MTTGSLPRLGMTWVTWRQHRAALIGVLAILGGLSLYLLVTGLQMHAGYTRFGLDRCHIIVANSACDRLSGPFVNEFSQWNEIGRLLVLLPGLIGMFVGAPLIARELETGTFRFAWTQGAGRIRWTATKLALLGTALTAGVLALSQLYSWWDAPYEALGAGRMSDQTFDLEGFVGAARTLFAFALGVFAGAVIRRIVAAMAAAFTLWLGVVLSTIFFLRRHYQTPISAPQTVELARRMNGVGVLDNWYTDPDGHRVGNSRIDTLRTQLINQGVDPSTWLRAHHYTHWQTYQPASRFWTFQTIESSGLCALALILGAATLWWVRRRTT